MGNPYNPFYGAPCHPAGENDPDWWTDEPRRADAPDVKREKTANRQKAHLLCETACRSFVECARAALEVDDTQGTWAGVFVPPKSRWRDHDERVAALARLNVIATREKVSGAA